MHAMQLAMFVAIALFMLHLQRGRERTSAARCVRCNAYPGDRHARDCPWRDKYGG